MDNAEEWQERAIELFERFIPKKLNSKYQILNPRRDEWDNDIEQTFEDPAFSQQVNWEEKGLERADMILFYFDPDTTSAITLLELGSHIYGAVVVCPEGYYRKGNVDIFCERREIVQKDTLEEAVKYIIKCTKKQAGYKYDY